MLQLSVSRKLAHVPTIPHGLKQGLTSVILSGDMLSGDSWGGAIGGCIVGKQGRVNDAVGTGNGGDGRGEESCGTSIGRAEGHAGSWGNVDDR